MPRKTWRLLIGMVIGLSCYTAFQFTTIPALAHAEEGTATQGTVSTEEPTGATSGPVTGEAETNAFEEPRGTAVTVDEPVAGADTTKQEPADTTMETSASTAPDATIITTQETHDALVALDGLPFIMEDAPDFGVRYDAHPLSFHWFSTYDGNVAYCLDLGRRFDYSTTLDYSWNPRVCYWIALLNGYPCNTTFNGVALDAEEARSATQLAIWALKMDGTAGVVLPLGDCYAVDTRGQRILDGARWLAWKAVSNPSYALHVSLDELAAYVNFARLTGSSDATLSDNGESLVFGPFQATSDLATANLDVSAQGLGSWFFSDAQGNPAGTPGMGSVFYITAPRVGLPTQGTGNIFLGTGYLRLAALIWGNDDEVFQNMGVVYNPNATSSNTSFPVNWHSATAVKVDNQTDAPLAQATFALDRLQGEAWQQIGTLETGEDGLAEFGALAPGEYRLREACPPPAYASASETGGQDWWRFTVDGNSTGIQQVFRDEPITLSCAVDKSTIALTSAAFVALPGQGAVDNVGSETYAYHISYESTANVRADEFTVDDPLENVAQGLVEVRDIWTPTSQGDTDGLMNVWYRTNLTDADTIYSKTSAMSTNPHNPNNPDNTQQLPNTGWKLLAVDVDCQTAQHLGVSTLGLAPDEHITALRFEHGSVEVGFGTQRDAIYLVAAAHELKPTSDNGTETIIASSVQASIFRNQVLTDTANDAVETRVIDTFATENSPLVRSGMAKTADGTRWMLVVLPAGLVLGLTAVVAAIAARKRRRTETR